MFGAMHAEVDQILVHFPEGIGPFRDRRVREVRLNGCRCRNDKVHFPEGTGRRDGTPIL